MPSNNRIEEVGDKRKISGKENIKKAQAALKEKREKEKNKPLEFESDDEDETPVLTFKNKEKKRYKEIEAKMDLLNESQRQLREDFQKRKEKKKKVVKEEKVVEEKIFHNDKEYVIPKKFIEAYNERIKIEKKLKEEKEEQYKDLINSKKKFQKSEKQKQQLIFNECVTKISSAQNLTKETKRKIFEAIKINPQRSDDRRQAKSNAELINELKKILCLWIS